MPKNKAINLLPLEEFNASTTGRVLKWATGTFRVIVIITEMVVMGAFLSRFWLDAQNSTLNNAIKAKSAQISAQTDLEQRFRNTQLKLNVFKQIDQSNNLSSYVDNITSKVPENITLSKISIEKEAISITGSSLSDYDIAVFIASLQNPPFKEAVLSQVGSSENNPGETNFTVSAIY